MFLFSRTRQETTPPLLCAPPKQLPTCRSAPCSRQSMYFSHAYDSSLCCGQAMVSTPPRTRNPQSARPGSQRLTELTVGFLCAPPGGWKGPGQHRTKPQESSPVTHSRFIINDAAGTLLNCSAVQEI